MAAMRRYKGAVKLLDLQGSLPEWAVPSEAMMGWRVPDPEGVSLFRFYSNWTDVPSALKPPAGPLRETMFPDEELAPQLSRCVRFLPSPEERQGRTAGYGGSFFALFGKVFHRAAHAGDWDATKPSGEGCRQQRWQCLASRRFADCHSAAGNGGSGKRPKFARIYRELEKDELETLEEFYGLSLDRMLPTPAVLAADCSANGSSPRTLCALSRAVANAAIRNAAGLTASQVCTSPPRLRLRVLLGCLVHPVSCCPVPSNLNQVSCQPNDDL